MHTSDLWSNLKFTLLFQSPPPISWPSEPGHLLPLSPSLSSFHSPSCPSANTSCSIQTEESVTEDRLIHKPGKERVSDSARSGWNVCVCRGSLNTALKAASGQNGQGYCQWVVARGRGGSNQGGLPQECCRHLCRLRSHIHEAKQNQTHLELL